MRSNGRKMLPVFCTLVPLVLLASVPLQARGQAPPAPAPPDAITLTLEEATTRALAANPSFLARALDLGIADTDIGLARERPNPGFTYESTRDAPRQSFVLLWPVEMGSKRTRRVASGEASREVVKSDRARDAANLRGDVRRAFYRLLAAQRRAAVGRELISVVSRARDAVKARVDSGDAPRLDEVQANLALARVANLAATADGERAALQDELDGLVGLPAGTSVTVTGDLFADGLAAAAAPPPGAGALGVDVVAAATRAAAATAGIGLARAQRVPDLSIETGLTYDAPPDFTYGWKAGVSLTVPLFTTHRVAVVRAEQVATQATRLQAATSFEVDTRVAAARRRATAFADAVTRTTRDILPAADILNDMAQASYESGQTDIAALLLSLRTVAETRLDAVDTALSFQMALADLERARGITP